MSLLLIALAQRSATGHLPRNRGADDSSAQGNVPDMTLGANGAVARSEDGGGGSVTATQLMALIERQGFRCALTGRTLTPANASADHITPISKGGAHEIGNIQIVHRDANQAKGTMNQQEFVQMCREVVKLHELGE